MKPKAFSFIGGLLFFLIALAHLTRIVQGWSVVIAGWDVPIALSWVPVIVGGCMAYYGLKSSGISR